MYERKFAFGTLEWPSSQLKSCSNYESMNPVQRGKKLGELQRCARCTSWSHKHKPGTKWCSKSFCQVKEQGNVCGKDHDRSLHGSGSQYCSAAGLVGQAVVSKLTQEIKWTA